MLRKDFIGLQDYYSLNMLKPFAILIFVVLSLSSFGQHIVRHRDYVPLPDQRKAVVQIKAPPVEIKKDTVKEIVVETPKTKKRNANELITECDFTSHPDKVPQLPYTTNLVDAGMKKRLKEKYEGRLYSITAIEAGNNQQNYKLRVCIKGKLQIEYVNEDGKVIDDPTPETLNN